MTDESENQEDDSLWGKLGKKGTDGMNHITLDDMDSLSYSFGDFGEKKRKAKN
jgi:hypothetical protein